MGVCAGSAAQLLHRDEINWAQHGGLRNGAMACPLGSSAGGEITLTCVLALTDFHAEAGATVLAPGSHRWDKARQPADHELRQAVMPAGGAVLYTGQTLHGAGANTTAGAERRAIQLGFVLGYLRTEENHQLQLAPRLAAGLPQRALELLGFV
jgi:ectoine hydroxylase-related dioxygenase (phytanoyl-CoA dioxygenase family)